MTKRIISLIVLIFVLIMSLGSCSEKPSGDISPIGEMAEPKAGGVLRLGTVYIDTMNPIITEHASVSDFLSLVYEGLFALKSDLTVDGILAESFSVSNNNTVYTINLKKGITFHNGKPFTAHDVTATFEYISLYSAKWKEIMKYISGYSAQDDNTVVITLNTPKTDFINNLDFPILPSGLAASDFSNPSADFIPIGTGMYKYDKIESHRNIILKANDKWRAGKDKANISEVDVEILSDEGTIVSAFDAGTIDALTTSWRGFDELELTSGMFNTFQNEQNRFIFIGINTLLAKFDTAPERQALWQSIDREKITRDIMIDKATAASAPIRDGVYYDLPEDEEEKNSMPVNETPIECRLLYNSDSKTKNRIAIALKQQLESKGYMVELDGQSFALYNDKVAVGDYDLYIGEVNFTGSCDMEFMFSNSNSICNYEDAELTTLVTNLDKAIGEKEKQIAWQSFKKYYKNTAIQVPLYFTHRASFVNKRIRGSLIENLSVPYLGLDDMFIQ